jgi:exodeoxyribonuclease VII small subunit
MAAETKEMHYKDALEQLQAIVRKVETSSVDVDELADAIRNANELVKVCKTKLRTAETEVQKALDDMRGTAATEGDPAIDKVELDD